MKKFILSACLLGAVHAYADTAPTEVFNYESMMLQAQQNPTQLNEKLTQNIVFEVQPQAYKLATFKNILILSKGENGNDPQKLKLLGLYFDNASRTALKGKKLVKVTCGKNRAKIDQSILISLEECKVL